MTPDFAGILGRAPRVQPLRFGLPAIVASAVFTTAFLLIVLDGSAQEPVSTYTTAEATRGAAVYTDNCAECHGSDLSDGSAPALIGPKFKVSDRRYS